MDIQKLLEQAQKMQQDLGNIEEELSMTTYIGKAGGKDGVTVKVNGRNEAQEVIISDELINLEDKEMLQDLLLIAFNDAVANAAEDREGRLGGITQGLKLPGM
jgi:DNA-binding YbaB/EbfC family protein